MIWSSVVRGSILRVFHKNNTPPFRQVSQFHLASTNNYKVNSHNTPALRNFLYASNSQLHKETNVQMKRSKHRKEHDDLSPLFLLYVPQYQLNLLQHSCIYALLVFISTHEFEIEFKQIEHLFIDKLYDAIYRDAFFLQYN